MRVVSGLLLLLFLTYTGTGCALFKKNGSGSSGGGGIFGGQSNPPPPRFPGGPADPIKDGASPPPAVPQASAAATSEQAVLAGRVVDPHQRPSTNTYIRWVRLDDNKEAGEPIDVEVNGDGYFFIPGLRPGSQYKLIAHSKQGDKTLANVAYAQAPRTNLFIQVKEEYAATLVPTGTAGRKTTPTQTSANETPSGPVSAAGALSVNNSVPDLPVPVNVPVAPAAASSSVAPPSWAPAPVAGSPANTSWPPALHIANPNQSPPAAPPAPPRPPALAPTDASQSLAPRVPSCVLVGRRLENLALRDTRGEVWEFRTSKRGKLVLFDFWAISCPHCLPALPELNRLQSQLGGQGLEVVGIALEADGSVEQQAARINEFCRARQVNYRQLLGEPTRCNITAPSQFNVPSIPKMVLCDEDGSILWEHSGAPDRATLGELERLIQRRLSSRTS
jgi:thiol-disulfide isomerase/thioredoxin